MTREILRVANCSGFYGDRMTAAREMVEGGPIDVLTGDYLAELTMMILWKNRQRRPETGYATTFLKQMEQVLGTCLDRGIKVVTNAGGLNPAGLASGLAELNETLGLGARIAHVRGDDVLATVTAAQDQFPHLDTGGSLKEVDGELITANAYLGGWGIADALGAGADVVICPRVTDASLVVGPAAWAFDWDRDDWDRLAGAVAAGHIIECSAQATGGNYSFSHEIPNMMHLGFPIAEMHPDGSCVITKHDGTGGQVNVGTVTSQLLYEIDSPRYLNPDVVADFGTIQVEQVGEDRVAVSGATGSVAPESLKVCINYLGGAKQNLTVLLTGDDLEYKSKVFVDGLMHELGGAEQYDQVSTELISSGHVDPVRNAEAVSRLVITFKDRDEDKLGRPIFNAVVSLALASYAGFTVDMEAGRGVSTYGVYWPSLIDRAKVQHEVVLPDGSVHAVEDPRTAHYPPVEPPVFELAPATGATERVKLGLIVGARSGDKGGNANIGLFARTELGWHWLKRNLGVPQLRQMLPEADDLEIVRFELPTLWSLNFVVKGLLGEGVASSTRVDPQAKGLGEFIRCKHVDVPRELLDEYRKAGLLT
jgi:hypothetical protein